MAKDAKQVHRNCRGKSSGPYGDTTTVYRFPVKDEKVPWEVSFPDYKPTEYTSPVILSSKPPEWADPVDPLPIRFNAANRKVNRVSYHGNYKFDLDGHPLNPMGRTGMQGRGCLGKWGPNHAADAIVSRFRESDGMLQFIAIERCDVGMLAIPGGMIDAGESAKNAAIREFMEEALDNDQNVISSPQIEKFFAEKGEILYQGYVDDRRNTDNAWIETSVFNFHDTDGIFNDIKLKAGSDALKAKWMTICSRMDMYASHFSFIMELARVHDYEVPETPYGFRPPWD